MIYLDNAATSFPKPSGMAEAMMEHMVSWCGNPGRAGHRMSRRTAEAIYNTRQNLADFFSITAPDRIIFTKNATEALNLAIRGTLSPGDHTITTSMEHNSVLRPLRSWDCTVMPCNADGSLDISRVEKAIKRNTRMIACTHASNVTGTVMPIRQLADLCKKYGLLFLVDAAQSAGHIPVDANGIDMIAAPGHKGLLGPMGTGFLYIRPGLELNPLMHGGTGTYSKVLDPPVEFPQSYEAGTVNAPGIIGLGYSIRKLQEMGADQIRYAEHTLIRTLDEMLRNMEGVTVYGPADTDQKAGIVTFNIEGRSSEEVALLLDNEFGIATRAGFHCAGLAHKTIGTWDTGAIRMSVSIFNNMRQMELAADAVYRICRQPHGFERKRITSGCRR